MFRYYYAYYRPIGSTKLRSAYIGKVAPERAACAS